MSYKRIGTLIHNWSHQFISLMNYVDDDYVFDEMMRLLSGREVDEITLDPLNRTIAPVCARTPRLKKSLLHYSDWLLHQMKSVNVQPHELGSFNLVVKRRDGGQAEFTAVATDDRGKEYIVNVIPSH